jgi:4-hydroxybenzoate polyprenyltransferase
MSRLESTAILAVLISIAMFATTLQAQDFKDREGDHSIGRRTLPIVYPSQARLSMFLLLPMWSICLTQVWGMDAFCSVAYVIYAGIVGSRFMVCKTTKADRVSCKLYSVSRTFFCMTSVLNSWKIWFSLAHILPGYWRYFHEA